MQVRVFYQNLASDSDFSNFIIKDEKIVHYLRNVLRLEKFAEVFVFNESFELRCTIEAIDKKFVQFDVLERVEKCEKLSKLTLFLPILKRDKLSFLISSITQLGVENVIFYTSQHSSNSDKINFEKLELNMIESLEQCRGFTKTKIHENIMKLKDIPKISKDGVLYIGYEKFLEAKTTKNDKNNYKFL
jgi:RsmE family RNA methyltransferase